MGRGRAKRTPAGVIVPTIVDPCPGVIADINVLTRVYFLSSSVVIGTAEESAESKAIKGWELLSARSVRVA